MDNLTPENYKETIGTGNVVVDLWAEWCGPCKMMSPIFEKVADQIENVTFAKINTEEIPEVTADFGVRGIPTIIMIKDGDEVERIVGVVDENTLKEKVEKAFSL